MMALVTDDPFAAAEASAARLTALAGPDDAAVVLGSGWSPAADAVGATETEIPLAELGGFPASTVPGHAPTVRSVAAGTVRVLVFLGRVHLYEGLSPAAAVHGVRTAVPAGSRTAVLTNAAAGIALVRSVAGGRGGQGRSRAGGGEAGRAWASRMGALLAGIVPWV